MRNFCSILFAIVLGVALGVAAFAPSAAYAQSVEERVEMLLGDAYADYDMLQLDAAEDKLFQALDLVEEYDIRTPGAAGAYLMLGVVWAARSGEAWDAFDVFVDGLTIDPIAEIHPYYATPSLVDVLEEARLEVPEQAYVEPEPYVPPAQERPRPQQPVAPQPPVQQPVQPVQPPVAGGQGLSHVPTTEASGGRPIELEALVSLAAPVHRVTLSYRPFGSSGFVAVDMRADGDGVTFKGDIPGHASRGVISIDYYIEAVDRAGNLLGNAGSPTQPISVFVLGTSDGPSGRNRSRSRGGSRGAELFHLSLGVGSGIGLATGEPNVYYEEVDLNAGLAPTPLHLGFELGIAPTRGAFHIVPFARIQLVFLDSGVEIEPLFGIKARYFFRDDEKFRVYGQGGLGYGRVSHLVQLTQIDEGTYDTTNEGPIHVGGGVGFIYMLSNNFGLQLDTYLMAMFPDFSIQLDGQLGIYLGF